MATEIFDGLLLGLALIVATLLVAEAMRHVHNAFFNWRRHKRLQKMVSWRQE